MLIKSLMKLITISFFSIFLITGFTLLTADRANAQPPDTSRCDYLSGQGKGLCQAGIAAGCADNTGSEAGCANIEGLMENIGVTPFWLWPPCSCDYSIIPQTLNGPWDTSIGLTVGCGGVPGGSSRDVILSDQQVLTGLWTKIGAGEEETGGGYRCYIKDVPSNTDIDISLSGKDERDSCAEAALGYARELDALFPGVLATDQCFEW